MKSAAVPMWALGATVVGGALGGRVWVAATPTSRWQAVPAAIVPFLPSPAVSATAAAWAQAARCS